MPDEPDTDDSETDPNGGGPYVRESKRVPFPGVPFEPEPPLGREEVFSSSFLYGGRHAGGPSITDAQRAMHVNQLVAPYADGELILIDLLLTETNLAGLEQEAVALALAARNRIDVLRLLYDGAEAHASRFEVHCGTCDPREAYRSLARKIRKAVFEAVVFAHTADAFLLLQHIESEERASALPERQELAQEAAAARSAW